MSIKPTSRINKKRKLNGLGVIPRIPVKVKKSTSGIEFFRDNGV
jgi:hypothetical protein